MTNRLMFAMVSAMVVLSAEPASGGETLRVDGTEFVYRVPQSYGTNAQIMVLFGGRNWPGDKTLKTFHFDELADRHGVFLLSPSFHDRDYWEPEAWSGETLKSAVRNIETKHSLTPSKLYLYGYSAGGQCAALFQTYMPERVGAWGAHACGVYPSVVTNASAPALVTCGLNDAERVVISRQFIYRYREAGGALLWKICLGGHELDAEALMLARTWFDAVLSCSIPQEFGEDDTMRTVPASELEAVDVEFRNPLYNSEIKERWLR